MPSTALVNVSSRPLSVSGVILLTPGHVGFFLKCLVQNLQLLSRPFDELVIVSSGLSWFSSNRIRRAAKILASATPVRILSVPLGSVGRNRNRGWDASQTDLVAFLDSDDLYHKDYVQFISESYLNHEFDVLLHTCEFFASGKCVDFDFPSLTGAAETPIRTRASFTSRRDVNWESDPESFGDTGLWQQNQDPHWDISQGHMTVRKGLRLRFHENPAARNEDGIFLNQALLAGLEIDAYDAPLSYYRQGSSSYPLQFRIWAKARNVFRRLRQSIIRHLSG